MGSARFSFSPTVLEARRWAQSLHHPRLLAVDAGPADPGLLATVAHTGNEEVATHGEGPCGPEEAAFGIGRHLFDRGCDFDFIDCGSLEAATTGNGLLEVADAAYRVLVFPAMHAVRMPMIEKAREFVRAGLA